MKSILKKPICFVLILLVIMSCFCLTASSAAGRTSIAYNKSNPKIDETVTVTITFTSNNAMLAASGTLSYSSDILQYVSGTNTNNTSAGTVALVSSQQNVKVATFSITFKVKKAGTANLSLYDCLVSDLENEYELTGSSVKLVTLSGNEGVTSQSSSSSSNKKSSNADLKEITVAAGTLTPAFSKNVTEYRVTVPYDKTDGILTCKVADAAARLAFGGSRDLAVGLNKRTITVTAEDGTKKVYTVIFNRLDENGNDTTKDSDEEIDSNVEITYNGTKYFLTGDFAEEVLPAGFSVGLYNYNEQEVSCIKDPSGKLTALCLVAEGSEEKKFFLYDTANGFSDFNYIEQSGATYIILDTEETTVPSGYTKTNTDVLGMKVTGFFSDNSELKDYVILSAMGPDGVIGFYRFDTVQNSIQRYPEFGKTNQLLTVAENEVSAPQKLIVIALLLVAVELIVAIIVITIVLIVKSAKKKAKNNDSQEEIYDIEEESDEPDSDDGVDSEWIKTPDEDSDE